MASLEELGLALQKAHQSGNVEHARILAKAYQEAKMASQPAQQPVSQPETEPVSFDDGYSGADAALIGAGKVFDRIGKGMQQGFYNLTGNDEALADLERRTKEEDQLYSRLQGYHPFATAMGEALPSMAVPMGAGVKAVAAASALPSMLEYGTVGERAGRGAINASGGLLGFGLGKTAGFINRPFKPVADPARDALVAAAERYDIPVSVAQKSGNRALQFMDSALDVMPGSSSMQYEKKLAQQKAYNRAVGRTFGADADQLTPDILQTQKRQIGDGFNDLSARNRLNFTNQTLNDVAQHSFDVLRKNTKAQGRIANNFMDDLLEKVEPDGTISGEAYRVWDSDISRKIKGTQDGDLRKALTDGREIIRKAMDDSIAPADQAAWKDLRQKYAKLQTVADVVKNTPTGDVSPAGLLNAVNRGYKNAKFDGGGDLGELGRIGKSVLQKLPSSGTAERGYWIGALSGGLLGIPAAAATMLAPMALQKGMWKDGLVGKMAGRYLDKGLIDVSPEMGNSLLKLPYGAGLIGARALEDN